MSVAPAQLPSSAAYTDLPVFRLSVEQYHGLIEHGKLTTEDAVELVEGVLVYKMPKNPIHRICNDLVDRLISLLLPKGWSRQLQEPITLSDSEPEPDCAIYRGTSRNYVTAHPGPADLAVVIEVSDSTLRLDRTEKHRAYARAGIPIYWIVSLVDRQIEVHTDPDASAPEPLYKTVKIYTADRVPVVIAGQTVGEIAVADVLP